MVVYGWLRQIMYLVIKIVSRVLRTVSPTADKLFKRLNQSPGIPLPNPSTPYWQMPPSPISKHGSDGSMKLPDYADIVVLGSGITGTSFVRTLMRGHQGPLFSIVMLEARECCSGATGRNGGHITPVLYSHYPGLKEEFGTDVAKEIIRFRLDHLPQMLQAAAEDNLLISQCREVDAFDVFHDAGLYHRAKEMLSEYQQDLPSEGSTFQIHDDIDTTKVIKHILSIGGPEYQQCLHLHEKTVGCLSTRGGAMHPYRFVTGILERLLKLYPRNFYLFTHTPCTVIRPSAMGLYQVLTPKGAIETCHVIHATNAWASHLLPGMRKRIVPVRGVMTAQMPPTEMEKNPFDKQPWTGAHSFVIYPSDSMFVFDYLTQQQVGPMDKKAKRPTPQGEIMLGGGFASNTKYIEDVGNVDDRSWNLDTAEYLAGALSKSFEVEAGNGNTEQVKSTWSGIIGLSSDEMPWIGRVPESVSGRKIPQNDRKRKQGMAAPGEWIAAGYSGEGMVHAWLSGKGLAEMVGKGGRGSIPEAFRMKEERWKQTGIEDMIGRMLIK